MFQPKSTWRQDIPSAPPVTLKRPPKSLFQAFSAIEKSFSQPMKKIYIASLQTENLFSHPGSGVHLQKSVCHWVRNCHHGQSACCHLILPWIDQIQGIPSNKKGSNLLDSITCARKCRRPSEKSVDQQPFRAKNSQKQTKRIQQR